jgi:ferritin-like protein
MKTRRAMLLVLLLAACSSASGEIQQYVNEDIASLVEMEEEAVMAYESVTGANYTDDLTTYEMLLNEVIPKYNVFIEGLEEIQPENEELRDIHENYIEATNI